MDPPARDLERVTPELVREATAQLVALVEERLPERFYPSEPIWRACLTGLVARMASIVESMALLAEPDRQADALVLLRSLYEHAVTFLWLAIDPKPRVLDWHGHTISHRRTLHLEALWYGAADVLTPEELKAAEAAERLEALDQRAQQVDDHWGPRIRGFHVNPAAGPKNVLTWRGLYTVIYRLASRNAHATIESIDPWFHPEPKDRIVLRRDPREASLIWSVLALPVFAMVLVVAHERLGWPDEERVREINDGLVREGPPTRAGSASRSPSPRRIVWAQIRSVNFGSEPHLTAELIAF